MNGDIVAVELLPEKEWSNNKALDIKDEEEEVLQEDIV